MSYKLSTMEKNIYPARDTTATGIEEDNLFVSRINGHIARTVILSHEPEPGYVKADWNIDLDYNKRGEKIGVK